MSIATAASISRKCPPKLAQLFKSTGFDYQKTADICGMSKSYIANLVRGTTKTTPSFNKRLDEAIARHKNGEPPPLPYRPHGKSGNAMPPLEQLDKGDLGIAIVVVESKHLEAVFHAGEEIGGKWVYRRKLGGNWLAILAHKDKKALMMFRALGKLGADVVTP